MPLPSPAPALTNNRVLQSRWPVSALLAARGARCMHIALLLVPWRAWRGAPPPTLGDAIFHYLLLVLPAYDSQCRLPLSLSL